MIWAKSPVQLQKQIIIWLGNKLKSPAKTVHIYGGETDTNFDISVCGLSNHYPILTVSYKGYTSMGKNGFLPPLAPRHPLFDIN